jgi:hypothetical protein
MTDRIPEHIYAVVTDPDPVVRFTAEEPDAVGTVDRMSRRGQTTVWRLTVSKVEEMDVVDAVPARLALKESRT